MLHELNAELVVESVEVPVSVQAQVNGSGGISGILINGTEVEFSTEVLEQIAQEI